ncbi:MAG: hypothetical protein ACLRYM_06050 [Thomasclavelia ramosa]
MGLFETVREHNFADAVENYLASIADELKKANLLKERELELADKEIELKENNTDSIDRYKKAYDTACKRLAELDKLLYSYDEIASPISADDYKKIFLDRSSDIHNDRQSNSNVPEISEKEFKKFISALDFSSEDKKYYESIQQKFGESFMFYCSEDKAYVCYDYVYGENGMPNVETVKGRENAKAWLLGQKEIEEISNNHDREEIEIGI